MVYTILAVSVCWFWKVSAWPARKPNSVTGSGYPKPGQRSFI